MKHAVTPECAQKVYTTIVAGALVALALAVCAPLLMQLRAAKGAEATPECRQQAALPLPALMPWNSVGGCGAGGSGGGGGGGAKWIGEGASGGLIDIEVMRTVTVGQNHNFTSINTRLSGQPHWKLSVGAGLPWNSKIGEVQYQTNEDEKYAVTGGIGDISVDAAMTFGATGSVSLSLGLSLPTGQYDIKRGPDAASFYLPSNLQNGTGMYNASLTLSYSRTIEDGLLLFDAGYSHPFMMRLFSGENAYLNEYFGDDIPAELRNNSRFYYRFKPYGENDLGDYLPASVNFSVFYGNRKVRGYVHSFGVTFSAQLGQAYIRSRDIDQYNPLIDPDHQMWAGSFNYGLEFTRPKYPIFISVIKPIHDKATDSPWSWDGPDWKNFIHSWGLAIGVKSTVF